MFSITANLSKSVSVINGLDNVKTSALLTKIIQKIHLQNESPFSEEEMNKLQTALSLTLSHLELVIESTQFIFQQAAYHSAKPGVLGDELSKLDLTEDKVKIFVDVWSTSGRELLTKLKQFTVAPKQLSSVSWRLNLEMSESSRANLKDPNAFFEFRVSDSDQQMNDERIQVQFSHSQLYDFYNKLETIQAQIDGLS